MCVTSVTIDKIHYYYNNLCDHVQLDIPLGIATSTCHPVLMTNPNYHCSLHTTALKTLF